MADPLFEVHELDVEPFFAAGRPPELTIPRVGNSVWRVYRPARPPDEKKPPEGTIAVYDAYDKDPGPYTDWAVARSGELVRIPLIPFLADDRQSYRLLTTAGAALGRPFLSVATIGPFDRMIYVVGKKVEDLGPELNTLRSWIGVAVRVSS